MVPRYHGDNYYTCPVCYVFEKEAGDKTSQNGVIKLLIIAKFSTQANTMCADLRER